MNYSYVCVLSTNNYLEGVLVLNENLKQLNTKYPLLCLINESINEETRNTLKKFDIQYKETKAIIPKYMNYNSRWFYTFDKLNIFNLTEYDKIVYLDSDFLLLENIDHLFKIEDFSMVFDYRPDKENYACSALMIIKPNTNDYQKLVHLANNNKDDKIGDQDIINEYFPNKKILPIEYNFLKAISDETIEDYDFIKKKYIIKNQCKDFYYSSNPKIIHYAGEIKPFMLDREFKDKYCYLYYYYLNSIREKRKITNE